MLLAVALASFEGIVFTWFLKRFFDVLSTGQGASATDALIHTLVIIACLELTGWLMWRIGSFLATYFQTNVMADLDNQSFEYLHKHSFTFFNNSFVGSLVKRVKWFSRAFEVIADRVTWDLLPLVVNITAIVVVLYTRNWLLAMGVLAWSAVFLAVNWGFTKYKLKYDIQKARKETETTGVLADTITNQANVKLFNGYKREVRGFGTVIGQLKSIRRFTWNLNNIFDAAQAFLMISFEIGILYLAVWLWQKGKLTVGDFVLIQVYLINIFHRVWNFGRIIRGIYEALADAEEMTIILNTPHEIQDVIKANKLRVAKGKIDFKNVGFYYRQTRKVLEGFNLGIKAGERVALVGPSGAGKTTVVKLLMRQHDVAEGEILIDGQNIAKATQESLRQALSLVPQDPILFHRSLVENIKYGKPSATHQEVIAAAQKAHCHEFIMNFDEKYNTYVGERGIKLSGGERQRVAIARAILRNAPVLILDEATSSLDSHSEALIQDAIDKLMQGKTVIVIAHRLSTVRKMDRIIVIDEGRIVEEGTHQELISRTGGKYRRLWRLQAGSFIE